MIFNVDADELLQATRHLTNAQFGLLMRARIARFADTGSSHGPVDIELYHEISDPSNPHLFSWKGVFCCCPYDEQKISSPKQTKERARKVGDKGASLPAGFMDLWVAYGKKGNRMVAARSYAKIGLDIDSTGLYGHIANHIAAYVKSTPDPTYRKNFETYLNQRHWENPIVQPQPVQKKHTPELSDPSTYRPV